MSSEQAPPQLRLNKRQRVAAQAILNTGMQPFEVREIVAATADQQIPVMSVCVVIDKLILAGRIDDRNDRLIEGWNGRLKENGKRSYLYTVTEEGQQALQVAKPTRVEVALGKIASMLPSLK